MMVVWKTKDPFASFFGAKVRPKIQGAAFAVSFYGGFFWCHENNLSESAGPPKNGGGFVPHIITPKICQILLMYGSVPL